MPTLASLLSFIPTLVVMACCLGSILMQLALLARETGCPVIASGGLKGLSDVTALLAVESDGVIGAITGRAIYEGTLDLAEAIALTESN